MPALFPAFRPNVDIDSSNALNTTIGRIRTGAGQLSHLITLLCTESSSVRCCTLSTGGNGGRRLPQAALNEIPKTTTDKRQSEGKR
jgi:hypothetical protein